jgi:multidrug efflux pump subunit AcrA (membrane-fusion protein)
MVFIENEYEGRISQIAPSVDSTTRKTEVRIATENTEIKNGDTVTITKEIQETANTSIIVPLTAVKFEIEDGYIFTVENGKLVQNNVKLGVVRGSSVEILDGLTAVQEFVVDARGLVAGNEVSVSN